MGNMKGMLLIGNGDYSRCARLSWDKAGSVKTTGTSEQDFHFDFDSMTDVMRCGESCSLKVFRNVATLQTKCFL